MATTTQFIPTDTGQGTVVGSTYVKLFVKCPRKWFNNYFRPNLGDSGEVIARGLQPRTRPIPLIAGGIFHEGLASWYTSGCRDGHDTGERSIDEAIAYMESQHEKARSLGDYESDEIAETTINSCKVMLRGYHDRFGPGANSPEWPGIQVAHDFKGDPLVEREYRIQLNNRYIYTCRSDLWVYHNSYLKTMEHKTSIASYVKSTIGNANFGPQFTGEIAVMRAHQPTLVPDAMLHGVLINVIVKDRSLKSTLDVAERDTTTRTDAQLERWRQATLNTLARIDHAVGKFERLLTEGNNLEQAADEAFPTLGTHNDECKAYFRNCDYYELCQLPGMEDRLMGKYRPRSREENDRLRELPY